MRCDFQCYDLRNINLLVKFPSKETHTFWSSKVPTSSKTYIVNLFKTKTCTFQNLIYWTFLKQKPITNWFLYFSIITSQTYLNQKSIKCSYNCSPITSWFISEFFFIFRRCNQLFIEKINLMVEFAHNL